MPLPRKGSGKMFTKIERATGCSVAAYRAASAALGVSYELTKRAWNFVHPEPPVVAGTRARMALTWSQFGYDRAAACHKVVGPLSRQLKRRRGLPGPRRHHITGTPRSKAPEVFN